MHEADKPQIAIQLTTTIDPIEVVNSLGELELTPEILTEAILIGEAARDACTANDPQNAPGFDAWARSTRGLRELLSLDNWTRGNKGQLATVVSPSNQVAIAVVTGDEGTGDPQRTPKTKYAKGAATVAAVENNQVVMYFLEQTDTENSKYPIETWMLLRRRTDDGVFAELSLPSEIGSDGRVDAWAKRIILEFITLTPTPPTDKSTKTDEIDFEVSRKTA